jgi:hypothetical protein
MSGTVIIDVAKRTLATVCFTLTNGCGSSLVVGASCSLSINFDPVSAALKHAKILVTNNASNSPVVY